MVLLLHSRINKGGNISTIKLHVEFDHPEIAWVIRDPADTKSFSADDGEVLYIFSTEEKLRDFADKRGVGDYVPKSYPWNEFVDKFQSSYKTAYVDIAFETGICSHTPIVKYE